eukprot:SM009041S24550  [mRNA]  locus=s9041:73:225:+ [translate_table: standard]
MAMAAAGMWRRRRTCCAATGRSPAGRAWPSATASAASRSSTSTLHARPPR